MRTVCQVIAVLCGMFFGYMGARDGYSLVRDGFGDRMDLFDAATCFMGVVMVVLSAMTFRSLRGKPADNRFPFQLLFARTIGPLFAGLFGSAAVSFRLADALDSIDKWPAILSDRTSLGRVICYVLIALLSLFLSYRSVRKAHSRSSETRPLFRQSAYELFLILFVLPIALTMFVDVVIYSDFGRERVSLSDNSAIDWTGLGMHINHAVVGIVFIVLAFSAVLRSRDSGGELGQQGAVAEALSRHEPSSPPERPGIEQSQASISQTAIQT